MKHAIRSLLAFVCLALSGWALADGVPLITPGPPISAGDPIRQSDETRRPDFVKFHPIALNKHAFGANVVTVAIDGKEYRLACRKAPPPPALTASEVNRGLKPHDMQSWGCSVGTPGSSDYVSLGMSWDSKGNMFGQIEMYPARSFYFTGGRPVLVETERGKVPFNPTLIAPVDTPASGAFK